MKFYLGLHQPSDAEKTRVPVFLSVARLVGRRKKLDHSDWIMDSGGFTMISKHGKYILSEQEYLDCIELHDPVAAFCQDWMCEDFILQKTGLTVTDHQKRTLESYLRLRECSDKILPVLQGWHPEQYLEHMDMYVGAGVPADELYGVGSVCSRNSDVGSIKSIFEALKSEYPEIQLHGFGVKSDALTECAPLLASADSMAWSARARRMTLCPECPAPSCQNCLEYALLWRKRLLKQKSKPTNKINLTGKYISVTLLTPTTKRRNEMEDREYNDDTMTDEERQELGEPSGPEKKPCPDCGKMLTWLADNSRPRAHKCNPTAEQAPAPTQQQGDTPVITVDIVVSKYIETRDAIAERKKAYEAEVAEMKMLQERREEWLLTQLNQLGMESVRTTPGTVFVDYKDSATVADGEAFFGWVGEDFESRKHFLDRRVNKTAVKQELEEGRTLPLGVNYTKIKGVKVRRS